MKAARQLNACGLVCPLPVLKARKALLSMAPGEALVVSVTDRNAPQEFALFCRETGHEIEAVHATGVGGVTEITLRRGGIL